MTIWLVCLLFLMAAMLWATWSKGPRYAVGLTAVLSLLVPVWVTAEVAAFRIDLRIAACLAAVGLYCVHPKARIDVRLAWIDLAGLGLLAAHLLSDWHNQGFSWAIPARMYGEWFLPYIAGRFAIRDIEDVRALLPAVIVVIAAFTAGALVEALLRVDAWALAFGGPPADAIGRGAVRWGIQRAAGPTMNPNFFAVLQLLLFPWAAYAAACGRSGEAARWWYLIPVISGAGLAATGCRAAVLGLVSLIYLQSLMTRPRWRPYLIAAAAVVVIAAISRPQAVIEAVSAWGGESPFVQQRRITVDGEEVPASSTMHRVYLFSVYRTAAERAGPFGFGSDAVKGFPVNVPLGPIDLPTLQFMRNLDNQYLLLLLRFGYVGTACFILFGLLGAATLAVRLRGPDRRGDVFFAATAAATAAAMLVLLTVWMPHDFGFWYLWTLGTISGLAVGRAPEASASPRRANPLP